MHPFYSPLKTLLCLCLLLAALLLPGLSRAAPTVYTFQVVDDSGAGISAATLTQTALKNIGTGAAIAGVTITPLDLGDGDWSLIYDPAVSGEAIVKFAPAKVGSTFSGANSLVRVVMTRDSGTLLSNLDAQVSTRLAANGYTAPPALPSTYPLSANDELLLGYLLSMIAPNGGTPRYLASSLALAPTGAGGAATDPFASVTSTVYPTGTFGSLLKTSLANPVPLPMDFVTALYGTHRWQNLEAAQVGALANNPATGVATFTRFDGTTFSVPVTLDSLGRITSRPAASQ